MTRGGLVVGAPGMASVWRFNREDVSVLIPVSVGRKNRLFGARGESILSRPKAAEGDAVTGRDLVVPMVAVVTDAF